MPIIIPLLFWFSNCFAYVNEQQIDLFGPIQTSQTYSCTSSYEICEYSLPELSIDQANQCDRIWRHFASLAT